MSAPRGVLAAALALAAACAAGPGAPPVPPPLLEPSLVPRDALLEAGRRPGHLAVTLPPPHLAAPEARNLSLGRGRFLVPSDRVVGVAFGGAARAYPLSLLRWHELVRDRVGGREVLVTYNPLSGSAAVWDPAPSGRPLRFTTSGRVYNSNLLLEDLDHRSLWSQVTGAAITGPAAAAGLRLEPLPAAVVTWRRWLELHPHTTVMPPLPGHRELYRRDPYHSYRGSDLLRFPVRPLPPPGSGRLKDPLAVVGAPPHEAVVDIARVAAEGPVTVEVGTGALRARVRVAAVPATAEVEGGGVPLRLCYRFAWFARPGASTSAKVSE